MAVPSPCANVCRMHPATGWCHGCYRTLDEIAAWSTMPDADKQRVWTLLPARRAEHAPDAVAQTHDPSTTL